ncbi:MAG: DUF4129 domain-containing protein [Chloroflexota bacterium]
MASTNNAEILENTNVISAAVSHSAAEDALTKYMDQPWLTSVSRPFLLAAMITCLDIAFMMFLSRFITLPPALVNLVISLSALAALVSCSTATILAQPSQRERRTGGYRIAEFMLLMALTRLSIWVTTGTFPDFMTFLSAPLTSIFDGYFVLGMLMVGISWLLTTGMTSDLMALALQPEEIQSLEQANSRSYERDVTRAGYVDRRVVLGRFTTWWIVGGVFLVMLSASTRVDFSSGQPAFLLNQSTNVAAIGVTILYFLCGLLLISQGQLALLRARWTIQKIPSAGGILRNWSFYVLIMVAAIAVVSALLPLGRTFWLANILWAIISYSYLAVVSVFQFILFLIMLLFAGQGGAEEEQAPAQERFDITSFPTPEPAPPGAEIPPWAGGTIFWIVMAFFLGYMILIYFRGKGLNLAWLATFWKMLRTRWASLFGAYQTWQRSIVRGENPLKAANTALGGNRRRSWQRWQDREPDEQVEYFYLSMLQEAEQAGVPRKQAETPLQFAPRLSENLAGNLAGNLTEDVHNHDDGEMTDGQKEQLIESSSQLSDEQRQSVHRLTDAFLQVRYAGRSVSREQIPPLQRLWEWICKVLRR